jgi:hypothetical protein
LEGGGCVALSEEHNKGFKEAKQCLKGHFPLVAITYSNIVVSPSNVELGEEAFACKVPGEGGDVRKGVDVLHSPGV